MRVTVVHSFYDDAVPSGENTVVRAQVEELSKTYTVELVQRRTEELIHEPGYKVRSAFYASGLGINRSIVDEVNASEPDIVHVHNTFPNIGTKWLKDLKVPHLTTLHNYRAICSNALLWRDGSACTDCPDKGPHHAVVHGCYRGSRVSTAPLALSTWRVGRDPLIRDAAAVIALNYDALRVFKSYFPDSNVLRLPNFGPVDAGAARCLNHERSGWLYIGRLTEEKNVTWLVRNAWELGEKLTLAGDGPLAQEVSSLASNTNGAVEYVGRRSESDVERLLTTARGIVIPSLWSEGVPTVALKALALGCPILISDTCGAAFELTRNGAGETFGVGVSGSLESAARSIAGNQRTYGDSARRLFEDDYSPAVWSGRMAEVIEQQVRSHRAAGEVRR
ncbi:glycosyltransferase family 4 protein [Gordonia sesuvii]|uniref:glycosyltransferase family 4 protein n=1 Tax=Gordonia sesuvii TaxID=3116777 RepID=UPI003D66E08B